MRLHFGTHKPVKDWCLPVWWRLMHAITRDLNHADLKTVLPKFSVNCAIRRMKSLDKAYSNIKKSFRAIQLPHLGQSNHMTLLLTPAYAPHRKQTLLSKRTVKRGMKMPTTSCRTLLKVRLGIFWSSRPEWAHDSSPGLHTYTNTAQLLLLWGKVFRSIPTGSPGWPEM